MRVLEKGDRNAKSLAYTSLVHPILEYVAACCDPCRGQISALDRVPKKPVQFTNHMKDSEWENLARRRTIARLCALFKAHFGNGLGKLYASGCEDLTICVGLIMF